MKLIDRLKKSFLSATVIGLGLTFNSNVNASINQNMHSNSYSDSHIYTVKKGDSLSGISQRFCQDGEDYKKIAFLNGIDNYDKIFPDQRIKIPAECGSEKLEGVKYASNKLEKIFEKLEKKYSDGEIENFDRIKGLLFSGKINTMNKKLVRYTVKEGDNPYNAGERMLGIGMEEFMYQIGIADSGNMKPGEYFIVVDKNKSKNSKKQPPKMTLTKSDLTTVVNRKFVKDERGYFPGNPEYNRALALTKTGDEIKADRAYYGWGHEGVKRYAKLLAIEPGMGCYGKKDGDYDEYFRQASQKFGLEYNILKALNIVESGSTSFCISDTGAIGVMQLTYNVYGSGIWNDGTVKTEINPWIAKENILSSAKFLSKLKKKYNGNWHFILTAYNRGETRMDEALEKARKHGITNSYEIVQRFIETKEGREYAKKVLSLRTKYAKAEKSSRNV